MNGPPKSFRKSKRVSEQRTKEEREKATGKEDDKESVGLGDEFHFGPGPTAAEFEAAAIKKAGGMGSLLGDSCADSTFL